MKFLGIHLAIVQIVFIVLGFALLVYRVYRLIRKPNKRIGLYLLLPPLALILYNLIWSSWTWQVNVLVNNLMLLNTGILYYRFDRKKKTVVVTGPRFAANCAAFGLSARETEVAGLIKKGMTYKAIADALFISEKTVDAHMQNIYSKVGERNKVSLLNKLES